MVRYSFHPALPTDVNVPGTLDFSQPFEEQVKAMIESAGPGLVGADELALPGQPVAAILAAAALEMLVPLRITLYGFGQRVDRVGQLSLCEWRNNTVRRRREDIPLAGGVSGYLILDGSGRGLTDIQKVELATLLKCPPGKKLQVLDISMGQVDPEDPTKGVVEKILSVGLTGGALASLLVLYLPPGMGLPAVVQAVALNGLSEYWLRTIRIAKGADGQFHVAEVVDPMHMRSWGSHLLGRWQQDATVKTVARLADALSGLPGIIKVTTDGTKLVLVVGTENDAGIFELNVSSARFSE